MLDLDTIVTVTRTGHGLAQVITSMQIILVVVLQMVSTKLLVVDANTFTDYCGSGNISGNVTYKKAVARGVVASNDGTYIFITGKGTGAFVTVN